jgi:hypothetical protein
LSDYVAVSPTVGVCSDFIAAALADRLAAEPDAASV